MTKQVRIDSIEVYAGGKGGETGGETGDDKPVDPNVMENQTYNPNTFDDSTLHEKMESKEYAIGLSSTGTYNVLVVPVQFSGDVISAKELLNLEKAFNGTSADTGWESVSSYYKKSSYGTLNISFDIQEVYKSTRTASYYENKNDYGEAILLEVLSYYASKLDLTKYDANNDGVLDGIYLIYSTDVDYDQADYWWAYVNWYEGNNQYDNLYPYYYLFAGFDFMDEDADSDDGFEYNGIVKGLEVNANTYIHETGHMLGLDDYYDYSEKVGSDEGLGGADMMDYAVGDHNAYSKIMLGWTEAEIVTSTKTVTLGSFGSTGDCILVPLAFNNSYFCEYLLIDFYTSDGLNALEASKGKDSTLYGGAEYGVRIYHVSSSVNKPYSTDYSSFTDYNNSDTNIPLIKLIEADGEKKFKSTGGYASASDLWQSGDIFSKVYASYARNDGKKLNFDIAITNVSKTSATVTITFAA